MWSGVLLGTAVMFAKKQAWTIVLNYVVCVHRTGVYVAKTSLMWITVSKITLYLLVTSPSMGMKQKHSLTSSKSSVRVTCSYVIALYQTVD